MNTFANSLFIVLFGWARGLIQQLWSAALSGKFSDFLTWLGNHWALVVLVLALGCTALDYLVWLIRWRPYLVWRTLYRRALRLFRREKGVPLKQFSQGYDSRVDFGQAAGPAQPRREEEAWAEEAWSASPGTEAPAAAPAFSGAAENAPRMRQFTPPAAYEAPPLYVSGQRAGYAGDMSVSRRRRRSEKYGRRASLREKLLSGSERGYETLNGLPPAVDPKQAFHAPVFPRQRDEEEDAYAAWQSPQGGGRTMG